MVACQTRAGDLIGTALNDDGSFGSHLRYYPLRFYDHGDLKQPMKSVIEKGICPDNISFNRLRSIGLVRGPDRMHAVPRCGRYRR